MKRKIIPYFVYIALLGIAIGVTIILYWLYSPPEKAIDISPSPIPVVNKVVSPDGTCAALGFDRCVVLNYTYCKNVTAYGRVVITIVSNTAQLVVPVVNERGDRKCQSNVKIPIPIPPQAIPGEYHIHFRATYQVNPLRTITQEYDTQSFQIT